MGGGELSCIPLVSREVRPFHVSADFITAGQNGATFSDQSAVLISWHHMQQRKQSFYMIYWLISHRQIANLVWSASRWIEHSRQSRSWRHRFVCKVNTTRSFKSNQNSEYNQFLPRETVIWRCSHSLKVSTSPGGSMHRKSSSGGSVHRVSARFQMVRGSYGTMSRWLSSLQEPRRVPAHWQTNTRVR